MRIYDGRDSFYQWDSNQKVVHNFKVGDEVHFFNMRQATALTVRAYQLNNEVVADVPNILLQSSYPIYIYWMNLDSNGQFTKEEFTISVNQRPKPSGYIYTETEVLSYEYLDARIDEIEKNGVSSEQISNAVEDYLEKNPITGGASQEEVAQIHKNKEDIEKLNTDKLDASKLPEAVNNALAQAKASGEFDGKDGNDYVLTDADKQEIAEMVEIPEGGTVSDEQIASAVEDYMAEHPVTGGGGLTTEQINALDNMFKVCAFTKADVSAEYNAFCTAFGIEGGIVPDEPDEPDTEITLSAILATYGGGDVVVGTALNDLTGIVVTAIYSDGTSEAVTGYTLSGTIAEGENTITVSYGGKTTTFTVVGVSAETGVSNETTWTDGVAYTYTSVKNEYVENGEFKAYNEWDRTPYLYCEGASKIRVTVAVASSMATSIGIYNAFYDENKVFLRRPLTEEENTKINEVGAFVEIEVPANAVYFIASKQRAVISGEGSNPPYLTYTPYE